MLDRVVWDTSCPDWADRIRERRSLIPDLPLFADQVELALRVFKRLRVPDIPGRPTNGEVMADWVFDLVAAIFGAYDPATRRRMIREFFVLIPKKNGKTSIAAAIMVTAAIINTRPAAELLLIGPRKKLADLAYKQAEGIIKLDPELMKIFHLKEHQRKIERRGDHGDIIATIEIKAADTDVITGSKATFILVDETHVFASRSRAADVFVEIRGSLASRPDGFLIQITTQSKDPPAGVFKNELEIARDVRDGRLKSPLLPVLYELPGDMADDGGWMDQATWPLVNPNMGRSLDPVFLADELVKARRSGPEQLQLFASQHFNVEVGLRLLHDRWPGADKWNLAGNVDRTLTLDTLIERSEVVTIGIDGGGADDLLGLCVIGREKVTRRWLIWSHAYADPEVKQKRKDIAPTLNDCAAEGSLTFAEVPDDVEHLGGIVARVIHLLPAKNAIGIDPNNAAAIFDALFAVGVVDEQLFRVKQGPAALMSAWWGLDRKLREHSLSHPGLKLMQFCVSNAKCVQRDNAVMITKQVSGSAKIDPVIAMGCAALMMAKNPTAQFVDLGELIAAGEAVC